MTVIPACFLTGPSLAELSQNLTKKAKFRGNRHQSLPYGMQQPCELMVRSKTRSGADTTYLIFPLSGS